MSTISYVGKRKRLSRLFTDGKTLISPIDDSLLFGPFVALNDMKKTIDAIMEMEPNAILGFRGSYATYNMDSIPYIVNITASTTMGNHVQKKVIMSPEEALIMGADCIAAHVNYTSEYENDMISSLAEIIMQADKIGMPVLAIAYPRKSINGIDYNYEDMKDNDLDEYTKLICHIVRTSVELGADIVKTQYTGTVDSFKRVIDSAMGVPVVIAGGPLTSIEKSYSMAIGAMEAGAAGISYGRNIFNAQNIQSYIAGLKSIIFDSADLKTAIEIEEKYRNV